MSRLIEIVPYDPSWPNQFEEEAGKIKEILEANCITIHHIGSTSVPGLDAKPVIDMIPVVKNITEVDLANEAMEKLGFIPKGEYSIPFRRYFQKEKEGQRTHNVHIFQENNPEIIRHLGFRDYLRTHPHERDAYAHLKKEIAQKFPCNIDAYTMGKTQFIQAIDEKAGFRGYRFVQTLTNDEWEAYHRIRQKEIFEPVGIVYDPKHPTLTDPQHFHFVLYKGNKIIGAAHIQFLDEKKAALRSLAIDQLYQRQGHGQYFLRQLECWLQHQNKIIFIMHAHLRAESFYRACGYQNMHFDDPAMTKDIIDLGKYL